jgi:hypothetical protein
MRKIIAGWAAFLLLVSAFATGCGGPASPSADGGAVLQGRVLGAVASAPLRGDVTAQSSSAAAAGELMVRVLEDPAISVRVASDGTFTLRGLPLGTFTLVFTRDGTVIGTQVFAGVQPNQEIEITVAVVSGEVVLLDERRTGIGHGDLEIEGTVEKRITVSTSGDSRFQIDGKVVIARPGVTAIREGNTARTVNDVTVGRHVHVKGTWVSGSTDVLASEIKLQDDASTAAPTPAPAAGGRITICHIPPGNPGNKHEIEVDASAWPAHQGHGDTMGACPADGGDRGKPSDDRGNGNSGDKGNNGNGNGNGKK